MIMIFLLLLFCAFFARHGAVVPPREPPTDLIDEYTLHGSIPLERFYVDDTWAGEAPHYVFTRLDMQRSREAMRKTLLMFEQMLMRCCVLSPDTLSQRRPSFANGEKEALTSDEEELAWWRLHAPRQVKTVHSLWEGSSSGTKREITFNFTLAEKAIAALPKTQWVAYSLFLLQNEIVHGKRVVVFGSSDPWLENVLLLLGAEHVVTVDYHRLTYEDPRITTLSLEDWDAFFAPESAFRDSFDLAVSASVFEHDGLGRYGDPLHPHADLRAMERVRSLLTPHTGRLLLTVPIGPDVVVFNLHRRYGEKRLSLLLQGWAVAAKLGWEEDKLHTEANWRQTYEPVWILKPSLHEERQQSKTGEEL